MPETEDQWLVCTKCGDIKRAENFTEEHILRCKKYIVVGFRSFADAARYIDEAKEDARKQSLKRELADEDYCAPV